MPSWAVCGKVLGRRKDEKYPMTMMRAMKTKNPTRLETTAAVVASDTGAFVTTLLALIRLLFVEFIFRGYGFLGYRKEISREFNRKRFAVTQMAQKGSELDDDGAGQVFVEDFTGFDEDIFSHLTSELIGKAGESVILC